MKFKIALTIYMLFFCSCQNSVEFEKKNEIFAFLENEFNIDIKGERSIIIFISGSCGSCTIETVNILEKLGKTQALNEVKKILIVPMRHLHFFDKNDKIQFELLKDEDFLLEKYGLNFDKNLIIEFGKDNKVKYWEWLYMDRIYNVKKFYKVE